MRAIGEINNEAEALRFGDYLYANGIANDVEEDDREWTIWIHDDDLIAKAKKELANFLKDTADPRYTEAGRQATRLRQTEAKENERAARRQVDVRTQVFGRVRTATPVLTYMMIGICVLVHLLKLSGRDLSVLYISKYPALQSVEVIEVATGKVVGKDTRNTFLAEITGKRILDGRIEKSVGAGQVWRVFTPMFLHFGFMHIIFNMYWLHFFGGGMEGRLGSIRFAIFILLAAALSNLGQYLVSGSPVFGGMSGVNYALFGYIWIRGNKDPSFGIQLDQGTIMILLIWFALCFTGLLGNIANTAHTIGLVIGAGWGWLAARRAMR
jgi:GlpG protein